MDPTPVLLIDMSRLVRDLLKELLTANGTAAVVGELPSSAGLIEAVDASGAQVVVIDDRCVANATHELAALLAARPSTRLISIAEDGRRTAVYSLRPHRLESRDVSPETLIGMIAEDSWAGPTQ